MKKHPMSIHKSNANFCNSLQEILAVFATKNSTIMRNLRDV